MYETCFRRRWGTPPGGGTVRHHAQPHEGAPILVLRVADRTRPRGMTSWRDTDPIMSCSTPEQPWIQRRPHNCSTESRVAPIRCGGMLIQRRGDDEEPETRRKDQEGGTQWPWARGASLERKRPGSWIQEKTKTRLHPRVCPITPPAALEKRQLVPELKLHGDAGPRHGELTANIFPRTGRGLYLVPVRMAMVLEHRIKRDHGQLRKEVVKVDGECKARPVNGHASMKQL